MSECRPRPTTASLCGILLVAAVYVHFLAFTQFGLLAALRASGLGEEAMHRVLGSMALAGIIAGFVAAALTPRFGAPRIAAVGFALAAVAAFGVAASFAFPSSPFARHLLAAAGSGAGLGLATVGCAATLRPLVRARRVGLHAGLGTGAAYALVSAPPLFQAPPETLAAVAAGAAVAGACAALGAAHRLGERTIAWHEASGMPATRTASLVAITLALLALVWLDSAAFSAAQNDAGLRARFWTDSTALWMVSAAHMVAAPCAGWWLDRRRLATILSAAFVLILSGHLCFQFMDTPAAWPAALYAAGVAPYSTLLAAFAALTPAGPRGIAPAWRAAWTCAVAGWLGSGAGIALAGACGSVPGWAPAASGGLLLMALALQSRSPTTAR